MNRNEKESFFFGSVFLLANQLQIWGDSIIPTLSTKQFMLLIFIYKIGIENPTLKEVSDFTGTSRQNVKKMLERLEVLGYVSLTRSETDARALSVSLTNKADEFFDKHDQASTEALTGLFLNISDNELDAAIETVSKLFQNLNFPNTGEQSKVAK